MASPYSAGTYRIDGPVRSHSGRFGNRHALETFRHGDRVKLSEPWTGRPDHDGDVYVKNLRNGRSGYLRAASLTKIPGAANFKVGDRVKVARDAKTTSGGGVFFGKETTGRVTRVLPGGDLDVKATKYDGHEATQCVAPEYLTKVTPPRPRPYGRSGSSAFGALREEYLRHDAALTASMFYTPPAPPVEKVTVEAIRKALAVGNMSAEDRDQFVRLVKAIDEGVRK